MTNGNSVWAKFAYTASTFKRSHDRFLIIDNAEVYHKGNSLKDLGKKMFAFSKLDIPAQAITDLL